MRRRTADDYLFRGPWVYIGDAFTRGEVVLVIPAEENEYGRRKFELMDGRREFLSDHAICRAKDLPPYHRDGQYPMRSDVR